MSKPYISKRLRKHMVDNFGVPEDASDETVRARVQAAIIDGDIETAIIAEMQKPPKKKDAHMSKTSTGPDPNKVLAGGGGNIRVKDASEVYRAEKSVAKHHKTGLAVRDELGREAQTISELEYAKAGVMFKHLAGRSGIQVSLTEHERALWHEMLEHDTSCGQIDGQWQRGIEGLRIKTLLNDTTSGGVHVNPEWFDANIVTFPLLSGELFPMVDLRDVPRGSSVEGASIGNVDLVWGVPEATAINPFDTDDLIAELNTSIHPVAVGIEYGRDIMADAAVDLGRYLTEAIGRRLSAELDYVIANGNGTTQPEGIFTASGLGTVNSENDTAGPPTVTDYELLLFGIGKQYRTSNRCCFISNDTTYQRRCSIAVDASSDQRRVFGMDHEAYSTLGRAHKIQNDIANTKIAFGDMGRFRLFRRQGLELEWIKDSELAKRNMGLLLARGRYGGRVVDPSAWAKMSDAQS